MLFCDRDVAPVFGHLSPLAGVAAPMRRVASWSLVAALAFPAAAWAHATLRSTAPHFARSCSAAAVAIRLHFDQVVRILPAR